MHIQQVYGYTRAPREQQIAEFIEDIHTEQSELKRAVEFRVDAANILTQMYGTIVATRKQSQVERTQKALIHLDQRLAVPVALGEFSISKSPTIEQVLQASSEVA